jgi:hypothetical protein
VDLPTDLAASLRDLAESIGAGDDNLSGSVVALVEDVRTAVSSYQGLRLTLVLDGWSVTLTAFADIDGQRPATSLRVGLTDLGPGFDPQSRIVFYAGTPGAFVDLSADLDYVHRLGRPDTAYAADGNRDGHHPAVRLDIDLPPESVVSGISGLGEYATINRAVGVLIGRGHPPDRVHSLLRHGAATEGLALPDYAARLLAG